MKKFYCSIFSLSIFLSLPYWAESASVYFTYGNDVNQSDKIKSVLESFGHTVHIGAQYFQLDGTQDLNNYQVVILVASNNWTGGDMPMAGQNALKNYVQAGHGLIVGEWILWKWKNHGHFQTLYDVLPATTDGSFNYTTPITYSKVESDPYLNAGLPDSFDFQVSSYSGRESRIWAKPGAHTYYDSSNLDSGVVGWAYGAGRVMNFSTCIGPLELDDIEYERLLSNAVTWAAVPAPAPLVLLASGLMALAGLRKFKGNI